MNATPVIIESPNGRRFECFPVAGCTECGHDTPHAVGVDSLVCVICEPVDLYPVGSATLQPPL